MDNTERPYIREIANMFSLQEYKTWEYTNKWKDKESVNNLTLYQLQSRMI